KVDELNSSETYGAITWGEGSNPGVYFIRVMGVERSKTARVVLVR
ncbi:hypothetical protein GX441_10230, partial [bacterium]|nr:hypothetical protein [bacterium]